MARRLLSPGTGVVLCVILQAAAAGAQRAPALQDDSPLFGSPRLAKSTARSGREPERDDPTERLRWSRRAFGLPSPQYKSHVLSEAMRHAKRRSGALAPQAPITGADIIAGAAAPTAGITGPVWVPIGPADTDYEENGSFTGVVRDSGRARTILPDPTNPDVLYFLTSGGGLWKTTNFTAAQPTWVPTTDSVATTGGGSVAFGRTTNVLYLGLGDPYDIILTGGAMLKSADSGGSWTNFFELGAAMSVRDVKVDTTASLDIVLAATDIGLYRSTDAGATYASVPIGAGGRALWSIVQTSAGWLLAAQPCSFIPATFCGSQAELYLSTDHGASWSQVANAVIGAGRTTLAVGAPGDAIVYAFAANTADTDQGDLFRSLDGGLTWTALNITGKTPTNANTDNPNMDLMHGQAWYNQMILVDPADAQRKTVYLGGDLSSAKTTDGGATWTLLSNWLYGQFGLPYVHADFHAAAIGSTGPMLMFGGDGGLFVSSDGGASWSGDKNRGLQTFLVYSLVSSPAFPSDVLIGTQDNGTRIRKGNTSTFNQPRGGDGIGTGWSQANANTSVASVPGNDLAFNITSRPPDFIASWYYSAPPLNNDAVFYTPVTSPAATADPTGKVFFNSSSTRVFRTSDSGWTWTTIGQAGLNGITAGRTFRDGPHAIGVSPVDLNHVAVIGNSGHVEITTNGGASWADRAIASFLSGFANTSSVEWADNSTLYVTSSANATGAIRIAKSTDGGLSWSRADSGLPDVPVNRLVVDPRDSTHNTLYAGNHLGFFRSTDGGASWQSYGAGLPNVRVNDIYMPPDGSFIRVATYGRGVWELPQLEFVSATLTDDVATCNSNGSLDNGEIGHLAITLLNQGGALSSVTATVTSSNAHVSFPAGNTVNFPAAAASSSTTAALDVALNGASGVEQLDFTIAFADPSLNLPTPVTAKASFRGNYNLVPNSSASDDFEAPASVWTVGGTPPASPDVLTWEHRETSAMQHLWASPESNGANDQTLTSPLLHVGAGPFSFTFQQRYAFFYGSATYYDGGVIELSANNGIAWTDIGAFASPGYDHVIASGFGNALQGRPAWSGFNPAFPGFTTVTVNLGTSYANQNILIRLRHASVVGILSGWEADNFAFTGLSNTPFTALVAQSSVCPAQQTSATALASSQNPSVFGQPVTLSATVTTSLGAPTGTVTFTEGVTTLGSAPLSGSGVASLNVPAFSVGSHSIVAQYSGDAIYVASASNTVAQVVNQGATATAVVSSLNPSNDRDAVTFTATVTAVAPATGTPTGTVQFVDGSTPLATVALASGTAGFTAHGLAPGTHSITAVYSGDIDFTASTSPVLLQSVDKRRGELVSQ